VPLALHVFVSGIVCYPVLHVIEGDRGPARPSGRGVITLGGCTTVGRQSGADLIS
jgi:hypothetical protein